MVTSYFNQTLYPVKIKTSTGQIKEVKPNSGISAPLGETFVKQKFAGTGWSKL